MTRIFMVRHGPTHAKSMVGWSDLPADLSDKAALDRLSAYLPQQAVVISSDLSRAVTTADAIQGTRTRLAHQSGLREINFGAWELRGFKEIEAETPDHIRAFWEQPGDVRPPDGESWHEICARVDAEIDTLIKRHFGQDIIVVAHFGAIVTQIQRAEQLSAYEAFGHRIDNLSVTEIWHREGVFQTGRINHLP
ncbi:MAG: histidine phosphatase family protein [Arenibacterium sp.]